MLPERLKQRMQPRLRRLYGDRAEECGKRVLALAERYAGQLPAVKPAWDERDVVLITYADQVRCEQSVPLGCLRRFLADAGLEPLLSTVHLLPFFPWTSDDGFSVIDYRQVDPAVGDWPDVAELGERFELMFDLVLNHVSSRSAWFQGYLAGREPYTGYFIEVDPAEDVSGVVRPRSLPLLTPVETSRGTRHVWTTFSDDQIDLNFAEPDVLVEMLDVLLFYLRQGARIIRLDAIAYLVKRLGTPCIHLPETHEVVKLMRDLMDELAPGAILLTETNVPHEENTSYFGAGDEAHMVYQFALAPLLLEALLAGDVTLLARWLADLEPPPPGCTTLNFTASHDGVGVRPLEGLMPPERFDRFIAAINARGGHVSTKRNADGTDSPYELNITYFSALGDPDPEKVTGTFCRNGPSGAAHKTYQSPFRDPARQVRRFLAGQAVMLALRGVPAVYFHSLVGTPNDTEGVAATGRARSINRRKFSRDQLDAMLAPDSPQAEVLEGYRAMLAARIAQPAFHPDGDQQVLDLPDPALLGFVRTSPDGRQRILVLLNASDRLQSVAVERITGSAPRRDLLGKGVRSLFPERPEGCCAEKAPDPFSAPERPEGCCAEKAPDPFSSADPFPLAPFQAAWVELAVEEERSHSSSGGVQ
ncbi:MAG: alpha-amylase family glycosyl hydrolase [Thermoguttaceae bacterium]|nr:alpha-amylase family glycosyl hydrolase [Thermoguttaceae bacterium]